MLISRRSPARASRRWYRWCATRSSPPPRWRTRARGVSDELIEPVDGDAELDRGRGEALGVGARLIRDGDEGPAGPFARALQREREGHGFAVHQHTDRTSVG